MLSALSRALAAPLILLLLPVVYSCGNDGSATDGGPPPPMPSITALSATNLSPGDTLAIKGSNFASATVDNRVVFNNALANPTPFFVQPDSLAVVVPLWANSGALRVISRGVSSAPATVVIERGLGEPFVVGGGASFEFKLPAPTGSERFIMIPYSASAAGIANFLYSVTPGTTSVFPSPPALKRSADRGTVDFRLEFEAMTRKEGLEHIERHMKEGRPIVKTAAPAVPDSIRNFWVLNTTTSPLTFTRITAARRYWVDSPTSAALIYADVNQPSGSFDQADYDAFGAQFDSQIFPTDTTFFGPPTDIDGNERVMILFTPEVNKLTPPGQARNGYISGFFFNIDLASGSANSNGGEVFYAMVPDPNNDLGNTFPKQEVTDIIPGTLAHEFEHMISFGYRFVTLGNGTSTAFTQLTWLEEGMAHIAENLNGFHDSNKGRGDLYLLDPGAVSIMGGDTLEQRGGIFLFLRYMGDQLGDGIFRSILRSSCRGRTCVQGVSGEDFFTSVANFLATVYLNGRPWVSDPKFHYK
ncbi:MAG: IPT/TIG domain-containing protein [Candidatus Krumholzibacteria bacterium]|nr:IPT/TIG domain-containing protein [Candidatus Krumholzibacteria bacterium]